MNITSYKGNLWFLILLLVCSFLISGCSGGKGSYHSLSREDRRNNHYKGHFKVGKKYSIKGKSYLPSKVIRYNKTGKASWYGSRHNFHGKKTANGDGYNKNLLTAAHRTLQLPSLVKVKNLDNGKSLIVLVNDRGPYVDGREIDLSERAASILGFREKGTAKVEIQYMHGETLKFLKTLGIQDREGHTAKKALANKKCSVNCHIKLVNLKYGYGKEQL